MPPLGDAYIPGSLAYVGEPVTLGATTVQAIVDRSGVDVHRDDAGEPELVGRAVTVSIKAGSLPGLATGATMTVDSTAYRVLWFREAELDGALTEIRCAVRA